MNHSFSKLKFSITNRCGGSCSFCYHKNSSHRSIIDLDNTVIDNTIASAYKKGVEKIHISGGDPILNPEFWKIMVNVLSYAVYTKLSINSQHLNIKHIEELNRFGLNEVSFTFASIDSGENNRLRGIKNDFKNTITLMDQISKSLNIKITVIMMLVPMGDNYVDRLLEFIGSNRGVFFKLQCLDLNTFHFNRQQSEFDLLYHNKLLNVLNELSQKKCSSNINNFITIPSLYSKNIRAIKIKKRPHLLVDHSNEKSCRYMLYNPHIRENGNVYVCCQSTDDRCIGNIGNTSLVKLYQDLWDSYIESNGLPFKSCQHCIFYNYYNNGENNERYFL